MRSAFTDTSEVRLTLHWWSRVVECSLKFCNLSWILRFLTNDLTRSSEDRRICYILKVMLLDEFFHLSWCLDDWLNWIITNGTEVDVAVSSDVGSDTNFTVSWELFFECCCCERKSVTDELSVCSEWCRCKWCTSSARCGWSLSGSHMPKKRKRIKCLVRQRL